MNPRELINYATLAAVLVGGVWAYRKFGAAAEGLKATGEKLGEAAWYAFGGAAKERAALGAMYYYVVHFAGGEKHAIPEKNPQDPGGVDAQGRFTFRGKKFIIRDRVNAAGKMEHWAFDA